MKYGKIAAWICFFLITAHAHAGVYEVGGSFSWKRSNFNAGSYNWTKAFGLSFGYYFTQDSEVEFSYNDSTTKIFTKDVEDITYRDRTYSVDFVYHLLDEASNFRPYVRIGVGQLNRDATGTYTAQGYYAPGRLDTLSVIGGLGFKLKVIEKIALKCEATSYLTGGAIGSWTDNISFNIGGAYYF